ncbi:MAG: NAD-binding protein [Bacteroidia bacterium]|nr:NAD-binding protein [Bacteroidia bacterium]
MIKKAIFNILRAFFVLTLITSIGVIGFMYFEDHSVLDAFYMTVITMSTVGFGTLHDLTPEGKIFVSILIIFTLGSFLYAISSLTTYIIEGEIRGIFETYRVNKEIKRMRDHIIICGLGRNGREAALELIGKRVPFIVVESNKETIESFREHYTFFALQGDATEEEVLIDANIKQAKGVITCLPEDAANVFVTLTARELNPNAKIVSRASHESTISKLHTAGASQVVLPNLIGGRKMARLLTNPALVEFVDAISGEGDSHFDLLDVPCSRYPTLVGQTIAELKVRERTGALVLGFKTSSGEFRINPPADKILNEGEILFVLGGPEQIQSFKNQYLS